MGGTLACGSDAGAASASEAMINLELAMLAFCLNDPQTPACFSPADALRAATLNSARSLGLEGRFGSLAPGKTADLVVLDGDPLADMTRIGAPAAAVFVDGRLVHNPAGL
jgi:imidazolonepropionase-like amidohydrolase